MKKFYYIVEEDGEEVERFVVADLLIHYDLPSIVEEHLIMKVESTDTDYYTIDLNSVIGLIEHIGSKPIMVMQTMLKYYGALKNAYHKYLEAYDLEKQKLDQYEASRTTELSKKDDSNELYRKGVKLTKANVEAAVQSDPKWRQLSLNVKNVQQSKAQLYSAIDIVSNTIDMCKLIADKGLYQYIDAQSSTNDSESWRDYAEKLMQSKSDIEDALKE